MGSMGGSKDGLLDCEVRGRVPQVQQFRGNERSKKRQKVFEEVRDGIEREG